MWFFIFYRARFVQPLNFEFPQIDTPYREDGPKLLVRSLIFVSGAGTDSASFRV